MCPRACSGWIHQKTHLRHDRDHAKRGRSRPGSPQVGKSLRLIVLQMPQQEPFALINPEIHKREGEREIMEACLSIPGYEGLVKRSISVKARGLDKNGKQVRIQANGLLAQALEHEIDHLDGILYTDRVESKDKLFAIEDGYPQPLATTNEFFG